ncbi:MAG TPA: NADPH-dependent FMN reductase [Stellaceae bacterium]|nr:NADPH-dependent FMN reductase [Stellaceae bacterium]
MGSHVLAISGSLRAASINSAFCRAASRLAPPPLRVSVFSSLGTLPLFNPDLETAPPPAVLKFRAAVESADALLIASPEYAHGVSGVLKNALDWLVSFEGFIAKPVVLVNTSPRAHHAYDGLREILQTMSADILPEASMALPLLGGCVTEEAMVSSPEIARTIRDALASLARALRPGPEPGPSFPID